MRFIIIIIYFPTGRRQSNLERRQLADCEKAGSGGGGGRGGGGNNVESGRFDPL